LRHSLSLHREADAVESAVGAVLAAGEGNAALRARDLGGTANTAALTSAVLAALAADAPRTSTPEPAFPAVELRD
jgi:isocitrate/isopropylmalate dehydrogenase